jgi:dTDP-4-amino-4,6-dideoxygalactose transaminase
MNQHTRVQAPLPFIDVAAQRRRLGKRIDEAIARVLNHCQFINGPEVRELERDLSAFCGAKHSIGVSSGTDALVLILMALGIGKGDAVFCPAFTFSATAESVALVGATPRVRRRARSDLQSRSGEPRARESRRRNGSSLSPRP